MLYRFSVLLCLLANIFLADAAGAASNGGGLPACAKPASAKAGCFAKLLSAQPAAAPAGYSPAQLRAAYGAVGLGRARIAVVDAYGDANIKADLDVYSRTFGLPVMPLCTSASQTGCFEKTD